MRELSTFAYAQTRSPIYEVWSASIGWRRDAFAAGYPPNNTPISAQKAIAAMATDQFIATAALAIRL